MHCVVLGTIDKFYMGVSNMARIKADYIDHMGSDLRVVNSARVSFDKESEWLPSSLHSECPSVSHQYQDDNVVCLSEKDVKLINYLAKHNHWTPFAHCVVTLRETVPIFIARQRTTSSVGFVFNEISRRYVDSAPEFFKPQYWRERSAEKKQGSTSKKIDVLNDGCSVDEEYSSLLAKTLDLYVRSIEAGVCPEQARMLLPQSMMTSYYVTGSLAAFARVYKLRIAEHAQEEIKELARRWNEILSVLFPVSWEALTCSSLSGNRT